MAEAFDDVHAGQVTRLAAKGGLTKLSSPEIQDAAINQLAIASVAYRENRLALSRTIRWSVGYGIPLPQVVSTTGLPEQLVMELLDEVD